MFPWFWWNWAPHLEYPLSGNVSQDILSEWFFESIKPSAGDRHVERKAFEYSSYGRQIGLISEILLSLVNSELIDGDKAKKSQKRLEDIYENIDTIKNKYSNKNRKVEEAVSVLQELKLSDNPKFESAIEQLIGKRQKT